MGTQIGSTNLRNVEHQALANDGKITADEVSALVKAAKGEDKAVVRDLLASDAFEPAARKAFSKQLLGKADTSKGSSIAGEKTASVTVLRTLGPAEGFADKYRAIATARLSGVQNTGVVLGTDGKWRAVELDKPSAKTEPGSGGAMFVQGLKAADPKKLASLRAEIHGLLDDVRAGNEIDVGRLHQARVELGAELFGVPQSEINVIGKSSQRKAGVINLDTRLLESSRAVGRHGAEGVQQEDVDPHAKTAVELDMGELEGRWDAKKKEWVQPSDDEARGVLFHEGSHLGDFELAKEWVGKWETATGVTFTPGSQTDQAAFTKWMQGQKTDRATRELVANTVSGVNGDTEARAYVGAAAAALKVGDVAEAKQQLETWVKGIAGGQVGSAGRTVEDAAIAEAKQGMTKDQAKAFEALLKAAK